MGARETQKTFMELFFPFVPPAIESYASATLVFNNLKEGDSSAHPVTRVLERTR